MIRPGGRISIIIGGGGGLGLSLGGFGGEIGCFWGFVWAGRLGGARCAAFFLIMDLKAYLESLNAEFLLSVDALHRIATDFKQEMVAGLAGQKSSLKMLPSFSGAPTGREKGSAMAIDFGGTNVRVLEAELDGHGNVVIQQMKRFPLVDPKGAYNYVGAQATAKELFGFIAERLGELAKPGLSYPLGHTFSFPCEQAGLNQARLIYWTKEFRTQGVEGQDIGELLNTALAAKGLTQIHGKAIINDTVGTLLAAAYGRHHVDVASICGTGHNTCYLQPAHPLTGEPMIVNMESGNFDLVPQTRFDVHLDQASERPGLQRLEKMISGYYLGEVVRLVLADLASKGLLPTSEKLAMRQVLGGEHLSRILDDEAPLADVAAVVQERFGWTELRQEQLACIQIVVTLVGARSAKLVAATFCGTIRHIDPEGLHPHVVAVDGSLYEKLPGYAENMQHTLDALMPQCLGHVTTALAKDGSGIGAAIAAATCLR